MQKIAFLRARSKGITAEDASTQPAKDGFPKGPPPRLICTGPHSLTLRSATASTCALGRTKLVTRKKTLHDSTSANDGMQVAVSGNVLNTPGVPLTAGTKGGPSVQVG